MPALTPYNLPDYNNLPPQFPPDCASTWGEDQYGIWFELIVNGIVQRFRWIPCGSYTMGSPEDESERTNSETLHEITFTQGFWLADTACTQALWESVMGDNPSDFKDDPQNPVETVSWLDAQKFIATINQSIPDLQAHLPTEVQWEYACRAGTTSPFSFGGNITPQQANYDGNHPYAGGVKGEYRKKMVPVKAFPANHWGLYQMHGNVWEWCFDEFQGDLRESGDFSVYDSTMVDNAEDGGVERVLRGGSWIHDGWDCRSAIRRRSVASFRDRDLGFRLAVGL